MGTRFTLERELGHGGQGRVLAVRDAARGGALVALKETHGAHAEALVREFELLATLRHRHLAEVHEFFVRSPLGGERAAYTQALVVGVDLYDALRARPELAVPLTAQLLAALAQLHAAGLAHLDLKPDNVLVEHMTRARLVDFGIAARLGSRYRGVRGSPSYLAPEVEDGAIVSASADLFALGVMLAEVALGTPQRARALSSEPAAAREAALSGLVDAAVARLAAALLARDPAARPASALAAARLFGELRKTSLVLVDAASATGLARSGGLAARAHEKERVLDAVRARRAIAVGGPPGAGRGALFESAAREAGLAGIAVERWPLVAEVATVDGFREALERLVPGAGALALHPAIEDGTTSPEQWSASLAAAAEGAIGELARLPAPSPGAALFVRHAAAAPAAVRAFLAAARRAQALPLALVMGDDGAPDFALGPIDAAGVRALVESRVGAEVAAEERLVSALATASGGLPGHVEALLEWLIARGALSLGEAGWRLSGDALALPLPPDIGEAMVGRVALLAAEERATLAVIAALSSTDDPDGGVQPLAIGAALARDVGVVIDDLVLLGLVRRDGAGALTLGHPALATAARAHGQLDAAAAERVLARGGIGDVVRARLEGGERGARRALMAARRALAGFRPEVAERACRLAMELADGVGAGRGPEWLEALSLRAEIADRLGPREAQLAALQALAAELREGDPRRLAVEARLFWTLTRMGDPSFEARGADLVARAVAAHDRRLAAEVSVHLAIVASQRGDQERAEALLLAARAHLAAPGVSTSLALAARVANNLGNVYAYRGEHMRARDAYREAHRLKVAEGDPIGERIALGNLALMALELGEPGRALDDLAASHALARRTGHRRGEAWSLLTLAEIGLEGASPRYARRRAEAAAAIAAALGDTLVEGDALTTLAEALLELGLPEQARAAAAQGRARAEAAKNGWTAARARLLELLGERAQHDRTADGTADAAADRTADTAADRTADAMADRTADAAAGPRGAAIDDAIARLASDPAADLTTRQLAARDAAERALERGDTARARALVLAATDPESERARCGVRWARWQLTRRRVAAAIGAVDIESAAASTAARLAAWIAAWPTTPRDDGVDDAALAEGPSRATVSAHPAVVALRANPSDSAAVVQPRSRPEPAVSDALASLTAADLDRSLSRDLAQLVRRLEAERAFLVRVDGGATQLLDARDADGEGLPDAKKRLPEAALEAAARGQHWRAPGPDNRGAIAVVPWSVQVGGRPCDGALILQNRFITDAFAVPEALVDALSGLLVPLRVKLLEAALAEARSRAEVATAEARAVEARTTEEIRSLRRELESTREQLGPARDYPEIVFSSAAMKRMLRQVDRVVATDLPVHIHGESGTGKELVARAIHQLGGRASGPFVPQNCTAIPPTLFESELFGHERGAFTGAMRSAEGLFRRAHGGTLFLDEIGDLPLELQAKLLRVLETGEVRPVGATRSISVDVRIVSATHRDLGELIKKGAFREDLYYRLNVIRIDVPALRERPEDIPVLVQHFLARKGPDAPRVDESAMRALVRYAWPGNVRQLENEVSRAALLADHGVIGARDLSPEVSQARPGTAGGDGAGRLESLGLAAGTLRERVDRLEAIALEAALKAADGNKSEVARVLGLSRAGLNLKLKRLGLWDNLD